VLFISLLFLSHFFFLLFKKHFHLTASLNRNEQTRFSIGISSMGVGLSYFPLPFINSITSLHFFPLLSLTLFLLGTIHICLGLGMFYKHIYKKASIGLILLLLLIIPSSIYFSFKLVNHSETSFLIILGYIRILTYPYIVYLIFKHSQLSPRKGLYNPRFDHDI